MLKTITLFSALALIASSSTAQDMAKTQISEACRGEVKTLCGANTDKKARRMCMKENRSKLTDSCQAEIKARHGARRANRADKMGGEKMGSEKEN